MPKTRAQKEHIVAELADKLGASQAVFVVAPKSINPNEAAELKIKLAEVGGSYNLVKNSLFVRALEKLGMEIDSKVEAGQNAIILAGSQSAEAAKIITQFIKDSEKAEVKSGYLEAKRISAADVKALSELPSREQMLAQVLATMNAPVSGFVNVLAGNIRNVVNVLEAIRKEKETQK